MHSLKHDRYYNFGEVKRNEALECLSKAIAKKGVFKHLGDEADTGRVSSRYWEFYWDSEHGLSYDKTSFQFFF